MFDLRDARFEHDACGTGFVATTAGRSHAVLELALNAVGRLTHRGAVSADGKTGDGAGVLTQIPYRLLVPDLYRLGVRPPRHADLGVAMAFLPRDVRGQARARSIIEDVATREGLVFFGWRHVPVALTALGAQAARTRPEVQQALIGRPDRLGAEDFERALYTVRRLIEQRLDDEGVEGAYLASCSHRTIVYKGMFVAPQLARFYPDLRDPRYETSLALFHQRYSTNTFPSWPLAQPFRFLAHNGEINTLSGNVNWMRARERQAASPVWRERLGELLPVIQAGGSDSAMLDNALELLVRSGRDLLHAIMMLVPEAWEDHGEMAGEVRAFYDFHAGIAEPWDGPAALALSDGRYAAAVLDRNGLRPARYVVTGDGLVIVASEAGVADIDVARIIEKGRLGPGRMLAVDTAAGRILTDDVIKREAAAGRPYSDWLARERVRPAAAANASVPRGDGADLTRRLVAFGYTREELQRILQPMLTEAKDPIGSMGDDTPLAVLGARPRLVAHYLKQRFAQVTNPPIDPLRERLVMSLRTLLGARPSLLAEGPEHARLIELSSPVLSPADLTALGALGGPFRLRMVDALFPAAEGAEGLERALVRVCDEAIYQVEEGAALLVISDRGADASRAPIPPVLAAGAVHQALIRRGMRMGASLIVETDEARDVHQLALLIGYGASVVCPRLAYDAVAAEARRLGVPPDAALGRYRAALDAGLLKIMSKMGISTISSYHGAAMFEAVGLDHALVEFALTGTPTRVGGIGLAEVAEDTLARHAAAWRRAGEAPALDDPGAFRFRKGGDYHAFHPNVLRALHRLSLGGGDEAYLAYAWEVTHRPPTALRDLLEFRGRTPIDLDEVEPVSSIVRRFIVSSMSHGSLSREAHEMLAVAMNRLGARSASGEGGEDPARYAPRPNGNSANSAIKQIASGRFGVTAAYLASAQELEIKMAQGSKPGEGGQIPGAKVSGEIARIRRSQPGITLISPPPHHDIYSIEDLAQLIYDLKQGNPGARVSVKLVSEAGVGTIAAGVVKAYADTVHIAGADGGTGASPLDSIKNAGVAWELGLAETQQTLVANNLRGRVRLRVDGGLKTGRDVVVAAMLGAEEFGFASAAVVALGCVMARQCHLNTCPVGIATQREDLRAKFAGTPERVINFMLGVADDVRRILASLGFRALDEIVGRPDLLRVREETASGRARRLTLERVLADPDLSGTRARHARQDRNDRPGTPYDDHILLEIRDAILAGRAVDCAFSIGNGDRAVGARIAAAIARRYGDGGLPDGTVTLRFTGTAGQSFGAWCVPGMRLLLTGEANDYVGKGMTGGTLVVRPSAALLGASHRHVIVGNTVLYGATGGQFFAAGRAGERFAVRNSGAVAVVEGTGDHGCEYMTGGAVVVLGETGRNFGAGMTGGIAFVLDTEGRFTARFHPGLVAARRVDGADGARRLRALVEAHAEATGSGRARAILDEWEVWFPKFWQLVPKDAPSMAPEAPLETAPAGTAPPAL
ncbi:MAG TPA: glutamate synthase large subunit [bacterium]|nr:glutamate synthase large subunit [bacterium]